MKRFLVFLTLAAAGSYPAAARAQVGRLLREGVQGAAKRTGLLAREGAEEAAEQSAKKLALPAFRESVEASAQTVGSRNAAEATADFIWQNKGSIAVGTAAAVALQPDVAKAAIEVTGKDVVRPLIESSAKHVAQPIVTEVSREAARALPWTLVTILLLGWGLARWSGVWLRSKFALQLSPLLNRAWAIAEKLDGFRRPQPPSDAVRSTDRTTGDE